MFLRKGGPSCPNLGEGELFWALSESKHSLLWGTFPKVFYTSPGYHPIHPPTFSLRHYTTPAFDVLLQWSVVGARGAEKQGLHVPVSKDLLPQKIELGRT